MPQSLAQLYTHLIFSTKNREPWLIPEVRSELSAYFGGILRQLQSPVIAVGMVGDHVHILFRQSKNISIAELVEEVKKSSSKWIKTRKPDFRRFYWQRGYAAFSVSASRLGAVEKYVRSQERHHRVLTFQDELRRFFKEYNVEYDERYVWDWMCRPFRAWGNGYPRT